MNIGQTYISNTSFTYVNSLLQNPFSTYLLTHQNSLQVRSNFCSCDSLYIVAVDWLTIVPTEGYFEERIDEHDGEQETSVLLHYRPDLVKMEKAGDGDVASGKIKSIVKNRLDASPLGQNFCRYEHRKSQKIYCRKRQTIC